MTTTLGNDNSNIINGSNGTDYLMGDGGVIDILSGFNGEDIAFYQGRVLDYTFLDVLGQLLIYDNQITRDGIDILRSIEYVQFDTSTAFFQANMSNPSALVQLPSLYHLQVGGSGNNVFSGDTAGALTNQDLMLGFSGNDTFNLRQGMDVAYGYAGTDAFNYDVVTANATASRLGYTYLDGGTGTDTLTLNFSGFASNGLTLSALLTAFNASNHSQVFDFSTIDSRLKLQVINIENLVVQNFLENKEAGAINLLNQVSFLPENLLPQKVADIQIIDDGLGTNIVSLSGADAVYFSIVGSTLRFNQTANFELQNLYTVTLHVDDPNLPGVSPVSTTFTLNITNVNEAPFALPALINVNENATVAFTLLTRDPDFGDIVHTQLTNQTGLYGQFAITSNNGDASYVANNADTLSAGEIVTETFSFTVRDQSGTGLSSTGNVTIRITGVNDGPIAVADSASVTEDASVSFNVLANDTDVDRLDTKTVTSVGTFETTYGHITLSADGSAVFLADKANALTSGQLATDSFTYTMSDNHGATSTATITINLTGANDPLVAPPVEAYVQENGIVAFTAVGSDPDSGPVQTIAGSQAGTYGVLQILDGSGTARYTALNADQLSVGQTVDDVFTYRVRNSEGVIAESTITIHINGLNDAPVAVADSANATENASVTFNVLANDTDIDQLDTIIVANPGYHALEYGLLVLGYDGTAHYTANNANFLGEGETAQDFFTYQIIDNNGAVSEATITINLTGVNYAPIANPNTYSVNEDAQLVVSPAAGILGNDVDIDGDTIYPIIVTGTAHGTLSLNSDGSFIYEPDANFSGTDTFIYQLTDGSLFSANTLVTINVLPINDAPVSRTDEYTIGEDTTLNVFATEGLLANDRDVDGNPLTAILVSGPSHGSLTLNLDGTFVYVPDDNFNGTDSFVYRANDGSLNSADTTVTINVISVNDVPTLVSPIADQVLVNGISHMSLDIASHFADADLGDTLTFSIVGAVEPNLNLVLNNGVLLANPSLSTPAGNYNITIRATDLAGDFVEDTFVINTSLLSNRYFDAAEIDVPNHSEVLTNEVTGSPDIIIINMPAHDPVTNPEVLGNMLNASINGSNQYQIIMNDGAQFGQATFSDITPSSSIASIIQFQIAGELTDVALYNNGDTNTTITSNIAYFMAGKDDVTGTSGNDYISMGAGNDIVTGGAGNDTILGGEGLDLFTYAGGIGSINQGVDHLTDFVATEDDLRISGATSQAALFSSIDFNGASGHLVMSLSNGTVVHFDNLISFIPTTFRFQGSFSATTYTSSSNTISDIAGNAFMMEGNDSAAGTTANNFISGGLGDDTIRGDGFALNNTTGGNDLLLGGAGNDRLYGDSGSMINSLGGNDTLSGGTGSDRFMYLLGAGTANQGVDHITDFERVGTATPDMLSIIGTFASQNDLLSNLSFSISNDNHLVMTLSNGTVVHFDNLTSSATPNIAYTLQLEYFNASLGLQILDIDVYTNPANNAVALSSRPAFFADGADSITGASVNNYISAGAGNDTISGDPSLTAGGDDILIGGAGSDKFVYALGALAPNQGVDHITDFAKVGTATPDILKFEGTFASVPDLLSNMTVSINGGHYVLTLINGTVINLDNLAPAAPGVPTTIQMQYNQPIVGLQTITVDLFTNSLDGNPVVSTSNGIYLFDGPDYLVASTLQNYIEGGAANDTIFGDGLTLNTQNGGADVINGGDGNDVIWGDATNLIDSNGGNDTLNGGDGNDTLIGDGLNITDTSPEDLGSVVLMGSDTLYGGAGNDVLWGDISGTASGNYSYAVDFFKYDFSFNEGADIISDFNAGGVFDQVYLTSNGANFNSLFDMLTFENLNFSSVASHLVLTLQSGTVINLNPVSYAVGLAGTFQMGISNSLSDFGFVTVYDNNAQTGTTITTHAFLLGGDDTVTANDSANIIIGGDGFDTINSAGGHDIIIGDNAILTNVNGTVDELSGGDGNDTIIGDGKVMTNSIGADDFFNGGNGNDVLYGDGIQLLSNSRGGVDVLFGGLGDNTIYGDAFTMSNSTGGDDNIIGNSDNDTLYGDAFTMSSSTAGDDTLRGFRGNDLIVGDALSMTNSVAGSDLIEGGTGNDVLYGDTDPNNLGGSFVGGNDIFVYDLNINEGTDTIWDFNVGGAQDTIRLYAPVIENDVQYFVKFNTPQDVLQYVSFDIVDGHYVMTLESGTVVHLMNIFPNGTGAPTTIQIQYDRDNGSTNDFETFTVNLYTDANDSALGINLGVNYFLAGGAETIDGNKGDDYIHGGLGSDYISGDPFNHVDSDVGDDVIHGGLFSDVIFGDTRGTLDNITGGDDIIYGGDGNDILVGDAARAINGATNNDDLIFGGRGNDVMWGDSQFDDGSTLRVADIFVFNLTDTVNNNVLDLGGRDRIMDFQTDVDLLKFIEVQDYDENGTIDVNDILSIANLSNISGNATVWFDTNQDGVFQAVYEASIEFANKPNGLVVNQTLEGIIGDLTTQIIVNPIITDSNF